MGKTTINDLKQWKLEGKKFASLTAYDASFSRLFYENGIRIMLVGDSLGMTIQGYDSTIHVSVEDLVYHTLAVRRGAPDAFVIADMPFMSCSTSEDACRNAGMLMQAGANMVKIEGGIWLKETLQRLNQFSVPVCVHMGMMPQSVHFYGGYKVQARQKEQAEQLIHEAKMLELAGAQLILLECVPAAVAQEVTASLTIPVIGIGAGKDTDGQILVMQDAFGITTGKLPRFTKNFHYGFSSLSIAIKHYIREVESEFFPSEEHIYK